MTRWEPRLDVEGRCRHCGRVTPAHLTAIDSTLAEGRCPRCGHAPFYVDRVIGYVNNIAGMPDDEALQFASEVESQDQLEVLFRVEMMRAEPRDDVMQRLMDRFEELIEGGPLSGFAYGVEPLPLPELKDAIRDEIGADEAFKKSYAAMVAAEVSRDSAA